MRCARLDPAALQWRLLEGEVLAIDFPNSRYLGVNPSGALLWPLLADGATVEELAEALVERWKLEPEQAMRDVERFLAWLRDEGLLLAEDAAE